MAKKDDCVGLCMPRKMANEYRELNDIERAEIRQIALNAMGKYLFNKFHNSYDAAFYGLREE